MPLKVFCGEALCKAPVTLGAPRTPPWPIACGACGAALYPTDVLVRLPPSQVETKRAALMTERDGLRVAASSADFPERSRLPATPPPAIDDVDRILAQVDVNPSAATAPPAQRGRTALLMRCGRCQDPLREATTAP
jgi:hypothetical protein